MFRNQYDTDLTTWSPQGRLHQIEYAMEAVKQGSAVVGVKSATHVVLATLKRSTSELSATQKKLFTMDDHVGIAIAGLMADARVLGRHMRTECMNYKYIYDTPMPIGRLALNLADKCQVSTQRASKRPFGVGILIAGYDELGPHLYQSCPSGNYYEFLSMAIGARSQSAKTYLERHFEKFDGLSLEDLIQQAVRALRETVSSSKDTELTAKNCAIAFVGKDTNFTIVENEAIQVYLDNLNKVDGADGKGPEEDGEKPTDDSAPMET
mmetsp:Transcript_4485/g.13606  ORF Transcript_4485/g.13606 Transcript_4485/m.13606 type:complete len:266 (+) Transcript_4485:108-905(+)|eukprot:CAMPEP_0198733484 /NCGR_PEP_ID=MMETSP1475-20131203/46106_1 /TAXON_ID= ORGANISM="Unidentified sp., Strain CCMP1999" /NCGR_SAMPLE_ID=MMETSP1475 /ASSEMBLY_ACC=CAM_ASM_001111 /LENGTH=265 /DNA_ID=CAMNT_0044496791 /DNA_START=71 /DNA_END=868 /DNA_ORIENTATION=-